MDKPIAFELKRPHSYKENITKEQSETDIADRQLLSRPSLSFRLQITLVFILLSLVSMAIIIGSGVGINRIQKKVHFLQVSERYLFQIEQARRWEKNYFLYGTNLDDAIQSTGKAQTLFSENMGNIQIILSPGVTKAIIKDLDTYRDLLQELVTLEKMGDKEPKKIHKIETALRQHGAEMVKTASSMTLNEQDSMKAMLGLIQRIPIYCLVVVLIMSVVFAGFLSQRLMKPLNRLIERTQRIAKGDFSPMVPLRKYRDEFTTVEVAINQMLEQLAAHQTAMMESHKLRAIGTLTAGVAHELNNPLNNIMLTAYSMREDYKSLSKKELSEMINDLIGEAKRSRGIVHNLLDFARENESVTEPLELSDLLEETKKLALNQVKVSGAAIEMSVQPDLPYIRGDRQQLQQVFLNLILNAADAVDKNGKIKISIEKADSPGYLAVHVEDNGCGIPVHAMPHIFDPFFTTKATGKGTGLGLSVSHGIVSMHGGRIDVTSKEGKSTKFTVTLPVMGIPANLKRSNI